jgi:hypothetical protein
MPQSRSGEALAYEDRSRQRVIRQAIERVVRKQDPVFQADLEIPQA